MKLWHNKRVTTGPGDRGAKLLAANRRRGRGKLHFFMDQWLTRTRPDPNDRPNTLQGTRRR